jgi:regulator of RNase E activity RraA
VDAGQVTVSEKTLDTLGKVGTPTLTGHLLDMGFRNTYMIGVEPLAVRSGQRMVGRARTLRFVPYREDLVEAQYGSLTGSPHREALEAIGPGEVLVVDAGGSREAAVLGDMFTRRVMERGGTGVVIDGVVRDLSAVRQVGLPVFAVGVHGAGIPRALMSVGRDEPIRCGDVPVIPGDVVVGDEDGVVVVPPHLAGEVAEAAFEHQEEEVWIRERLEAGESLHDVYPPNAEKRKELEAWKKTRRRG